MSGSVGIVYRGSDNARSLKHGGSWFDKLTADILSGYFLDSGPVIYLSMPKIQNSSLLSTSELRRAGFRIVEAGLQSIDTKTAVKRVVKKDGSSLTIGATSIDLTAIDRLVVVGAGKCSFEAALALEEILGDRISGGIVIDVQKAPNLKKIKAVVGDHPYSTERNVGATREMIGLLEGCKEKDFVIFIISGGGSALLCQPKDHTVEQEKEIMRSLIHSGADIYKMNLVRKHLSLARGGYLASYCYPAGMAALIFSDVPGDHVEWVSSGPTFLDTTTTEDARKVLIEYGIEEKVGFTIPLIETPKDPKIFDRVKNILACSSRTALDAMEGEARALGYAAKVTETPIEGEAREVGRALARQIAAAPAKTVLLFAGETTVAITGESGKGGRSLETGLGALEEIQPRTLVIAVASDGHDNTEFAGAVCDIMTKDTSEKLGLSISRALDEHISFDFFQKCGQYIMTGETGSNVADLFIAMHE
jgi:glycerate-2-kinase